MYHKYMIYTIIYGLLELITISSSSSSTDQRKIQDFTQADGFFFDGPAEKSSTNINENLSDFKLSAISTSPPGTVYGRRKISHISTFEHCFKNCPSGEKKPVCGNDGVIYDNEKQVHCARMCGKFVQIKPCNNEMATEATMEFSFSSCMNNCSQKSSHKYSPVCGNDGITYDNSEIIACAETCGKKIKVASRGICTFAA